MNTNDYFEIVDFVIESMYKIRYDSIFHWEAYYPRNYVSSSKLLLNSETLMSNNTNERTEISQFVFICEISEKNDEYFLVDT